MRAYLIGFSVIVAAGIGLGLVSRLFDASPLASLPDAFQGLAWLAMVAAICLLGWLLWRGVRSP